MRSGITLSSALGLGAILVWSTWVALGERRAPARCPAGAVALGPRCCAPGQHLIGARCAGEPASCPVGMAADTAQPGCVPLDIQISIPGGRLLLGPSDWEATDKVQPRTVEVLPFAIDALEVTHARWTPCASDGTCERLDDGEPGTPVTGVTPESAARFCEFAGGRLPTGDEWLFAAAGATGRRYPWGATGLVCRRAAFGLVAGPCAQGAAGPDSAGMRPDGATPEGVLDLAGNVAEWTAEPDGEFVARGGSYRSRVAGDLKSWSVEASALPSDHIGFRCAYTTASPP